MHFSATEQAWTFDGRRFDRGDVLAGVEHGGSGSLTLDFGFDTQDRSGEVQNLFLAGIASISYCGDDSCCCEKDEQTVTQRRYDRWLDDVQCRHNEIEGCMNF